MNSPNLSKSDCMSDVARICSIITFHLSKLWKVKFSILRDVIFLWGCRGILTLITLRSERFKAELSLDFCRALRGREGGRGGGGGGGMYVIKTAHKIKRPAHCESRWLKDDKQGARPTVPERPGERKHLHVRIHGEERKSFRSPLPGVLVQLRPD